MAGMIARLRRLRDERHGVTAVEYGIIAGAIALALMGAISSLRSSLAGMFMNLANGL